MSDLALSGDRLTEAISAAMVALYAAYYGAQRTTATTYINDNVVVCILEGILSAHESSARSPTEPATT